jgi:predicted DNA-binding transcriptional regulator YafY
MSQRQTTLRHNLIINKLRKGKCATFREISDYLQRESNMQGEDLTVSKRTFNRDMAEIGEIYGIYIKYDFSARTYFIDDDFSEDFQNRRMEALDVFNALKIKERQQNAIFLDNRQSTGTEHLYGLLHAINNRLQISFDYQKFYADDKEEKNVNPLAIKEFKYRWYLWAETIMHKNIVCYGLDRMSNLQISAETFLPPADFNLAERLRYCFGIISPDDAEPSEVILSFEPFQGQYIKSLPLHHTQQILIDNEDELRISLKIFIAFDFVQELLSYGKTVKVIQPQSLIDEVKGIYAEALGKY